MGEFSVLQSLSKGHDLRMLTLCLLRSLIVALILNTKSKG